MSGPVSQCDVLVAGAGPAGATIARLLALRGLDVVLVDPGRRRPQRLEMVGPSSLSVFAAAGLTPLLDDRRIARSCLGISRRWGKTGMQRDDFLRRPGGRGFVVDRSPFDAAVRDMAAAARTTAILGRIRGADRSAEAIVCRVATADGERTIAARTAVDATGRSAALARRMGARHILRERLVAAMQWRGVAGDTPPWLTVEDDANGWSYALNGPSDRRETWRVSRPAAVTASDAWVNASAAMLSDAAGSGWIAVGDAACAFDPIASQGLYHAISTALVAAGVILSADGLSAEAARAYVQAVHATFAHSERGRAEVYGNSSRVAASSVG